MSEQLTREQIEGLREILLLGALIRETPAINALCDMALRAAAPAETVSEPFAFYGWGSNGDGTESPVFGRAGSFDADRITRDRIPLYTSPPTREQTIDAIKLTGNARLEREGNGWLLYDGDDVIRGLDRYELELVNCTIRALAGRTT